MRDISGINCGDIHRKLLNGYQNKEAYSLAKPNSRTNQEIHRKLLNGYHNKEAYFLAKPNSRTNQVL